MEFIHERIAEINQENTAQSDLETFLHTVSKQTSKLMISEEWSGELDFAVLSQKGFHNIEEIEIYKANIIRLKNLPMNLKKLVCNDNLLTSLSDLPSSLVELNVANNYLETIDIGSLNNLAILLVSNNQLKELGPFGNELEVLECERNHLASLDLLPCKKLKKLHCSGNPLLVLKDPPVSLVDFAMDNNPLTEIQQRHRKVDSKEVERKVDYAEAIQSYFKMKAAYEEKERNAAKRAYEKQGERGRKRPLPPCVNCKRKVGTVFSLKNKIYRAICGDIKEPCSLNIQIFGGRASNRIQTLYHFKEQLEELKEVIIRQKMDTLFQYVNEKESAALFKKNLEEYHSTNVLFKEMLETHEEIYDSPYKRELIQRKEVEIYEIMRQIRELLSEYKKKVQAESEEESEGAAAIMESVVGIYDSLVHQMQALRMLKYKVVETTEDEDTKVCTLHKLTASPLDLEYSFGESPYVKKYITKK
jgi:hypothetical protein